jgi:hypothetical protein
VLSPDGDFTFTRGSNLSATRVNEAQLIEKGRENLILQSNQFDTTPWAPSNATLISGQSGYDTTFNAWKLESTNTSASFVKQDIAQSGVSTSSIYLKAGNANFVYFRVGGGTSQGGFINLTDGSVSDLLNSPIEIKATSVGNGWFRCVVVVNTSVTNVRYYVSDVVGSTSSDTGSYIYIQDAQLELGLTATSVITTGAVPAQAGLLENTPRLDYSGGATCPSLLLEPSRSNLVPSEYFQEFWSIASGGTRVYNQITSPEGLQNGTKMYPTNSGSFKGLSKAFGSSLSNTPYALSIFAKAGEFEHLYFYNVGSPGGTNGVWFNLTTGSVGTNQSAWTSAKIEDFGNGWYRCSAVITPGGSSDNIYILLADSNGSVTATTNGTDGLYIYGAQLEQGSYATSYIPNYGTPQTRAQDVCDGAVDAATFNDSEGVLYAEIAALADDGTFRNISVNNGTTAQSVRIYYRNTTNQITALIGSSSGSSVTVSVANAYTFNKIAFVYQNDNAKLFVNGVLEGTISGITMPTGLNQLDFNIANVLPFYGKAKEVIYFPKALSDLQLAILTGATTYETFDEMALALNYTVYE